MSEDDEGSRSIDLDPAAADGGDPASGGQSAACDENGVESGGSTGGKKGASPSAESELEDLRSQLADRDLQVKSLEQNRQKQDESIALLRSELGAVQIKHKEECYWLRLEVDNLRKDKEALEDRMAELYRDMRELDNMNEGEEDLLNSPVCVDSGYVLHLQSQLSKSMQTMGVLDNQIGMVKRSCDEVVKSLKEEIADVMDDKCRIEMELLNQLAVLDNEKRSLEDEYDREVRLRDERIKGRDDVIQTLREKGEDLEKQLVDAKEQARTASGEESREARERVKASVDRAMMSCSAFGGGGAADAAGNASASVASSSGFDDTGWKSREGEDAATAAESVSKSERDELSKRVEELERENALLEDKLREEREVMHETSDQLRQNLEEQDGRIEDLTEELEAARNASGGAAAADAEAILEAVHRDRDEALEALERVAEVWEKADETIGNLDDIMEDMRDYDGDDRGDDDDSHQGRHRADRGKVLSTLETATLVHSQIKVSLLLVELKLRNQLTTLRNDGKLPTVLEGGVAGVARPAALSGSGSVVAGGSAVDEASMAELIYHVDEVQRETLDSLEDVEKALMEQVEALERECEGESEDLRAELGDKIDALLDLKDRTEELEAERAELERKLDDLEGEKKELGRRNRELKGRAADADHGTEELRRELDRLEQENADLAKERKALERANRDLEKAKKEQDRSIKEGEQRMKDMDQGLLDLEKIKKELEESVDHYQMEAKEARAAAREAAKKAAEAAEKSSNGSANQAPSIDPVQLKMFEKLQKEIVAVVGKIREKNDTINRLTAAAEEHKVREAALKKELKRIMKRVRAIEEGSDRNMGERKSGSFRRRDQEES